MNDDKYCERCPLATRELAVSCPAHWDWPGWCGHMATGHPHWRRRLLEVAGVTEESSPEVVADSSAVAEPIPSRSLLAKALDLGKNIIEHVQDGRREAPIEVQAEREQICMACPHVGKNGKECKVCTCGGNALLSYLGLDMVEKRRWASSRCPLKQAKWDKV